MSAQGPVLDLETLTKLRANLKSKDTPRPVSATVVPAREPVTVTAKVVTPKTAVVKVPVPPVRKESLAPKTNRSRPLPPPPVPARDDLQETASPAVNEQKPEVPARDEQNDIPVAQVTPPAPPAPPAPPKAPAAPKAQAAAPAGDRPALLFSGNDLALGATKLKKAQTRVAPAVAKGGVVDAPKPSVENGSANTTAVTTPAAATPAKPKGMGMMGGMDELQAKIAASAARRSIKIQ